MISINVEIMGVKFLLYFKFFLLFATHELKPYPNYLIMYRLIKLAILFSLSFLWLSCQKTGQIQIDFIYDDPQIVYDDCDTITINIPSIDSKDFVKTQFDVKSLCESFIAIPLETCKESIIGSIDKVVLCDSLIFVGDFSIQRAIFVFNRNGAFLRKISRSGNGPGEYRLTIRNFWVDKENKIISIVDTDRSQIIYTDFQGKLISNTSVRLFGSDLYEITKDSILFFYCNGRRNPGLLENIGVKDGNEYNLYKIVNNKVKNEYFPINSTKTVLFQCENNFCPLNNQLFFRPTYDNRIFELTNDSIIQCRFMLQFPDNKNYKNSDSFKSLEEASNVFRTKDHISISGFEITESFLYIQAVCNRYGFNVLYNRKTNEKIYGLTGYANSFGLIVGFNDNSIVFAKDHRMPSTEKISHLFKEGGLLVDEPISDNANPILIIGNLLTSE